MDQSHQPQLHPSPDTQPNPTKYGAPRMEALNTLGFPIS